MIVTSSSASTTSTFPMVRIDAPGVPGLDGLVIPLGSHWHITLCNRDYRCGARRPDKGGWVCSLPAGHDGDTHLACSENIIAGLSDFMLKNNLFMWRDGDHLATAVSKEFNERNIDRYMKFRKSNPWML